jgi:TRAP-type C4-dicarboxylate transport system substrate-binding protein
VRVPADLKRTKLGTIADEPELAQAFKAMGYQMVSITMNNIFTSFTSGTIDSIYQSPIYIGGLQIFGIAKNMASINIAPVMGGIVMNEQGWRAIPEKYKPRLRELANKLGRDMDSSIIKLENDAITIMTRNGLVTNKLTAQEEELWYRDVEQAMPSLIGTTFDRDFYRKIEAVLKEYRGKQRS